MAYPQNGGVGDSLQILWVAAIVLNKQLWTASKMWSCRFRVDRGVNSCSL